MMEAGWAYSIWWLEQHQRKTSTFCFGVGTLKHAGHVTYKIVLAEPSGFQWSLSRHHCWARRAADLSTPLLCKKALALPSPLRRLLFPDLMCVNSAVALSQSNSRLGLQTSFYL